MLAGAIVIIIQAPGCKPLPEMNWWNEGPLYQIRDVEAFAGDKGLAGWCLSITPKFSQNVQTSRTDKNTIVLEDFCICAKICIHGFVQELGIIDGLRSCFILRQQQHMLLSPLQIL